MPGDDLNEVRVLVTRPVEQAVNLANLVKQHGGEPVLFPLLQIEPIEPAEAGKALFDKLGHDDLLIFVSANAVRCAQQYFVNKAPASLSIAAIGRGTANELARLGVKAGLVPGKSQDSEALLAMPELKNVKGRHVVIVRGEGGREKLAETLRARGAEVDYAEVYRRVAPDVRISSYISTDKVDVITITSGEALTNLAEMAKQQDQSWLFEKPLVVIHDRIAQRAMQLGFNKPVQVTSEVSDTAILNCLLELKRSGSLEGSE